MGLTVPQPLIDDIEAGRCVPFIGAGFSMNARVRGGGEMPDWIGLTQALAVVAEVSPDLSGPTVASAFERRFGRVQLIEAIRRALRTDHVEPGEAHIAFSQLPFDTIYTTNFDLLLEDSFLRNKRPFRSIVGELQMPFHGGPPATTIVKMHGDLRHEDHIIVTAEDVRLMLTVVREFVTKYLGGEKEECVRLATACRRTAAERPPLMLSVRRKDSQPESRTTP
jgi:hypothetical protein